MSPHSRSELVERVLGQGLVAAAHRHVGQRPARRARTCASTCFSSFPHSGGSRQQGRGICQQPRNTAAAEPVLRALLVALDGWVSAGKTAAREPRAAPPGRDAGGRPAAGGAGVPEDSGRALRRADEYRRPARLRPARRPGHPQRAAARRHVALPGARAPHGRGRARRGRRPRAGRPGPARDAHRLGRPRSRSTAATTCATPRGSVWPCRGPGPSGWSTATRARRSRSATPPPPTYVAAVERSARNLHHDGLLLAEDVERIVAEAEARGGAW